MDAKERFLAKVSKNKDNKCWEWTASRTQQGYGMFSHNGKSVPAHRFAYLEFSGEIPDKNIGIAINDRLKRAAAPRR